MRAAGGGVHDEVGPRSQSAGVVALPNDPLAGTVDAAAVFPGHHEAAVAGCGHARIALGRVRHGVDAELGPYRHTGAGEMLTVNAGTAAVLPFGVPDNDVAAVGQHRHLRRLLVAGFVRVQLLFAIDVHDYSFVIMSMSSARKFEHHETRSIKIRTRDAPLKIHFHTFQPIYEAKIMLNIFFQFKSLCYAWPTGLMSRSCREIFRVFKIKLFIFQDVAGEDPCLGRFSDTDLL